MLLTLSALTPEFRQFVSSDYAGTQESRIAPHYIFNIMEMQGPRSFCFRWFQAFSAQNYDLVITKKVK